MLEEIGGHFWLKRGAGSGSKDIAPLGNWTYTVYTSSGRGAIGLVLKQFLPEHKTALLPAYTCESVIVPFENAGYSISYFDIDESLQIDAEAFDRTVNEVRPSVILLHAYYGFDTIGALRKYYSKWQAQNIVVIEDITHSLFSSFDKGNADHYIASLRKWCALPDGGMAASFEKINSIPCIPASAEITEPMLEAFFLKEEFMQHPDEALKARFREMFYAAEDRLDADPGIYSMSDVSQKIFSELDRDEMVTVRRRNYQWLDEHLPVKDLYRKLFPFLANDVVPLYFPIMVKDRNGLQKFLAQNRIYAPIHWPLPPQLKDKISPEMSGIYDNVLSIPCDQRYSLADMQRITECINIFGASDD